jgi:1,2-diacylglycerol 3-beta-galactosyltransferase
LNPNRRRILFLFSDTGGGHRSAMEAIIEALDHSHPGRYECVPVDAFKEYAPPPLNRAAEVYPDMMRYPRAWGLGFRMLDGPRRARALTTATWPYVRRAVRRLVAEQPADLIFSVHPAFNGPLIKAMGSQRPPYMIMVTDLVTTHALWFNNRVDMCLVPTEAARQRGLENGLRPDQVRVVGLPVARRFCQPAGDPIALRSELGWPQDRPMVLVVGGGEGMGPFYETARALAELPGMFGLALVAGRNQALKQRLQAADWSVPTFIYGFEHRMPSMMQAATLLVTKAGPGTVTEALNASLPMVLYSHLPGQEDGNVAFVQEEGVGVWAPGPRRTAKAVQRLLQQPEAIQKAASACRRVARPQAASVIAGIIDSFLSQTVVPGTSRQPAPTSDRQAGRA